MPYSDPEKERERCRKYYAKNREKVNARQRERYLSGAYGEWFKENADRQRDRFLQRTYGISLDDYKAMLTRQDGKCALCRRLPNKRVLSVDHDHVTGRIRGLLCPRCNGSLGNLGDTAESIQRAADYVAGRGEFS